MYSKLTEYHVLPDIYYMQVKSLNASKWTAAEEKAMKSEICKEGWNGWVGSWMGEGSKRIEYILVWNLENPSLWFFSVPFSLKGSSKCTNHVNVYKLYAVEYINTVCSLAVK